MWGFFCVSLSFFHIRCLLLVLYIYFHILRFYFPSSSFLHNFFTFFLHHYFRSPSYSCFNIFLIFVLFILLSFHVLVLFLLRFLFPLLFFLILYFYPSPSSLSVSYFAYDSSTESLFLFFSHSYFPPSILFGVLFPWSTFRLVWLWR